MGDYIAINESIYVKKTYSMFYGENNDESSFNEIKEILIGNYNEKNIELYNLFIFKGFWRIIHECYGDQPIQKINNYKVDTPTFFYYFGRIIKNKRDAGNILEYFINNNSDEINRVKNIFCNVDSLLDYKLYINDFNEFWHLFIDLLDNLEEESYVEPNDFKIYEIIYNVYVGENEKDDKMNFMNLNKLKVKENDENKSKRWIKI